MLSAEQKDELITEFSDLGDPDIVLQKEVYAHFGLLFFKFALIEHSLINIITINYAYEDLKSSHIKTKNDWEAAYDRGFDTSKKMTLGNLIRSASKISEVDEFTDELTEIKGYRDYFAHHFFRDEVGLYSNEEGCWHILYAIKQLRGKIIMLHEKLEAAAENIYERLGIPLPTEEYMERGVAEVYREAQERLASGYQFPWQKA